jgi:hypothetical protein
MKKIIAAAALAAGLAGCANPPPPEVVANTVAWVQYLCRFQPTGDQIVEIITDNPQVTDVRAIAKLICAEFAP